MKKNVYSREFDGTWEIFMRSYIYVAKQETIRTARQILWQKHFPIGERERQSIQ